MTKPEPLFYPTILVINTTGRDRTEVGLIHDGQVDQLSEEVRAQELQQLIDRLLQRNNLAISAIKALAVLQGPGSFTGTRIGITTANTLNWLQKLPIIEIPGDNFSAAIAGLQAGDDFSVTTQARALY